MAQLSKFNYRSRRAQEARATVGITPLLRKLLRWAGLVNVISGAAIVLVGLPVGWLPIGLGLVMTMVYQWWRWRLYRLPIIRNQDNSVDALLSSSVLGRLPRNPSPRQIANILAETSSGMFLLVRFGISPRFLQELSSENAADTEKIWDLALEIRQQTKSETISGGVLALSLIRSFPNHELILANLQLTYADLEQGVAWHDYLHAIKTEFSKPQHTGGIARDWSFGFVPTLRQFGQNISEQVIGRRMMLMSTNSHQKLLDKMIETFSSNARQNLAIVGPDGAGKTTLVYSLAEKLVDAKADLPSHLKFRQVFLLDSSSLIAAAPGRGELERLVTRVLGEAYNAKNIIICLDNAHVFFEEGIGSVDISNLLLPILEAGRLRIILTINEQKLLQITQKNPNLANVLNKLVINPLDEKETMLAMQDRVLPIEANQKVIFMYQALKEAYRLSQRYVHDLVMPGRAIKLLETAAGYHENGLVTVQSVQQAIEQTLNVKVSGVSQIEERQKLLNLEDLIHKRMINQDRAVSVVANALRRARAGVRSQSRPIGTFLFLGPTGVGKTELAKSLSAVYFGGESEIVRLDLNEFVTVNDVARLIADGANNPHSLTAQVMKRPFSVVLLDEIEKAHPAVLSTLLQLLDEGVLRDENNREVSFRDAIVIATSNAGADRIREYIERGYELSKFEQPFIDELISSNQFRPEFLNRFDEIVVFRPLNKQELLQVLDLILAGVNKTLAPQQITIDVTLEARQYLVEAGYDPRMGARPMRRMVQSTVENIVAKQMIAAHGSLAGQILTIDLEQVKALAPPKN